MKMMEMLEEGETIAFDTILQGNIPNYWYDLIIGDHKMVHFAITSPTRQRSSTKLSLLMNLRAFYFLMKVMGKTRIIY